MRKCACHILFLYFFPLHTHHLCRSRTAAEDIFLQLSALSACCDFILCSTFFCFTLVPSSVLAWLKKFSGSSRWETKHKKKEPKKSFRRRREKFTTSHNDRFFIQCSDFFSVSLNHHLRSNTTTHNDVSPRDSGKINNTKQAKKISAKPFDPFNVQLLTDSARRDKSESGRKVIFHLSFLCLILFFLSNLLLHFFFVCFHQQPRGSSLRYTCEIAVGVKCW